MQHLEEMKTQKAWKAHFQAMIARCSTPHVFGGLNAEEWTYLLTTYHPEAARLEGPGISRFELRDYTESIGNSDTLFSGGVSRPSSNGKHMWVVRVDGSESCFSWNKVVKCARGRGTQTQRTTRAVEDGNTKKYRTQVRLRILEFKESQLWSTPGCRVTGEALTSDNSVVHHDPEFDTLLAQFKQATGHDVPTEEALVAWEKYHAVHAVLHLLSVKGHKLVHAPAKE